MGGGGGGGAGGALAGLGGAGALAGLMGGGGSGGGMQSKLIGMAMSEAGNLFDQQGGAASGTKQDAMSGAASTVMSLLSQVSIFSCWYPTLRKADPHIFSPRVAAAVLSVEETVVGWAC